MDKPSVLKPLVHKSDDFHGDRSVVISEKQRNTLNIQGYFDDLYLTDIGYYPFAKNHFRKRSSGSNEHILMYCTSGKGFIQVGEQMHILKPNSFFVIEKGKPHSYWASETSPWSIYWLHFGGNKSKHFSEKFNVLLYIEPTKNDRVDDRIRLFNEILNALELGITKQVLEFSHLYLPSLMASFFYVETYRAAKGNKGTDPVDKCIRFMQAHIQYQLKNKDFAEHVNLSASHLSKLFKGKTGTSPIDYFINLKMQEGIRLLSNRSMRVNEVAFSLGYADPFYFSRIFSKQIGVSPNKFLTD